MIVTNNNIIDIIGAFIYADGNIVYKMYKHTL